MSPHNTKNFEKLKAYGNTESQASVGFLHKNEIYELYPNPPHQLVENNGINYNDMLHYLKHHENGYKVIGVMSNHLDKKCNHPVDERITWTQSAYEHVHLNWETWLIFIVQVGLWLTYFNWHYSNGFNVWFSIILVNLPAFNILRKAPDCIPIILSA